MDNNVTASGIFGKCLAYVYIYMYMYIHFSGG